MFSNPKNQFNFSIKTNKSFCELSECSICYDEINKNNKIITDCNHIYCICCFKKYLLTKSENNIYNNSLQCPYCRQKIKYISLNNEEESEFIINEYCSINKNFNLLDPVSIYIYNDLYHIATTGDIYLEGEIDLEGGNDIIVIYPVVVSIILFIYACFIISIENDIIKKLINFLIMVLGTWHILYTVASRFNNINIIECYLIGWFSLVIMGTLLIINT